MILLDGLFKYGETVVVDVDGKLYKRKVHYSDGELYIDIKGSKIKEDDVSGTKRFDKSSYDLEYHKKHTDRVSVAIKKGEKERWRNYASELGMSLNSFVVYCVEKEIDKQKT